MLKDVMARRASYSWRMVIPPGLKSLAVSSI